MTEHTRGEPESQETQNQETGNGFDPRKHYMPVFYAVKPPQEYVDKLTAELARGDVDVLAIPDTAGTNVIEHLRNHGPLKPASEAPPFAGMDRTAIYEFFQRKLAALPRQQGGPHSFRFTHFTFLIVDAECLADPSDPEEVPEVLVCCDAPDIVKEGEEGLVEDDPNDVLLKCMPMTFEEAATNANALEMLTITPTEAAEESEEVIMQQPPAWMVPVGAEHPGAFTFATPGQARLNRRAALKQMTATLPTVPGSG